ncbi:MAG TPA: substrate-binding domain-containing protein, partial [Rhodopila sp.]
MRMTVRVLSAGAAKGLVSELQAAFTAATGAAIDGVFSAVGAIRTKFIAGEPCDALILTAKQLAELSTQDLLLAGSVAPIGTVRTAVAVPAGHPVPDITTSAAFAAAMRAASAIYVPDPDKSTAGIHVLSVLRALGLEETVSGKLRA